MPLAIFCMILNIEFKIIGNKPVEIITAILCVILCATISFMSESNFSIIIWMFTSFIWISNTILIIAKNDDI